MRLALFGTGYGATYLPGILAHRRATLVAIGSRGSRESRTLAKELEVPLFTEARTLLREMRPEVAIVAVPEPDALIRMLSRAGVRVLAEHPVSPAVARVPFLVNTHFFDLPAPRRFLGLCRKASRPRAIMLDVHTRALFSALDIVHRALGALELDGLRAVVGSGAGWPPAAIVGRLNGLPFSIALPAGDPERDDGHAFVVGHRISIAFARETVTLVDTYGPVVRTPPFDGSGVTWRVVGTATRLAQAREARAAANARAVDALIAGRRTLSDVDRTYDVARAWTTLRQLLKRRVAISRR